MPGTVGAALTWLPHDKRREFFEFLVGLRPKAGEMAEIGAGIAAAKDPRDAELLWGLLAAQDMGVGTAPAIQRSLWELYGVDMLMNRGGNVPVCAASKPCRRTAANRWQRHALATNRRFDDPVGAGRECGG